MKMDVSTMMYGRTKNGERFGMKYLTMCRDFLLHLKTVML